LKSKTSRTLIALTVLLTLSYLLPCCLSENYSYSYQLLDKPNGSTCYRLNVTVQQSLYDYYRGKGFDSDSNNDFAKFVTPQALKPIAECLWEIYTDYEDFANGVLTIVHQIPYEVTTQAKYPVETIVENKGDCDLFSFVAASIMKAGGLDVVLLYYESKAHMNIGVGLSHVPHDARDQEYHITYNNIKYYIAECTGENWKNGWRVGECPDDLKQVPLQVISLENCEKWAPGQVSASYKTLALSTLSLNISPLCLIQGSTITLSGQLSPALQNKTIIIYMKVDDSPWMVLGTVTTDSSGQFTYALSVENAGIWYVRASWSGDDDCAGIDSPIQTVTILSTFFVLLLATTVILICVGMVIFFMSRQTQQEIQEPSSPEIPS